MFQILTVYSVRDLQEAGMLGTREDLKFDPKGPKKLQIKCYRNLEEKGSPLQAGVLWEKGGSVRCFVGEKRWAGSLAF